MGIRKKAARLTATERDNFPRAALMLKNTIANPGDPAAQQISIYDQFVAIHLYTLSVNVPGSGASNMGHQNSAFGPWHRYYLLRFEQALQAVDPTVTLPYWDWTDHAATQNIIFQDNFMGSNGGVGGVGGGNISLPVAGNVPIVTVGGKAVRAKPLVSLTAEHQVEVTLVGRKIEIAPEGQAVKSAGVSVDTVDGERLPIKPNENLKVSIEISGNKLKVDTPKFIWDKETRKVFSSGTQEAMKIAMENRQPVATKKEAKDSGFQF
ncbi:MAG TPA: tyrosinase family protein [Blastocatellia bacterium]|jgi:hypothetical protein